MKLIKTQKGLCNTKSLLVCKIEIKKVKNALYYIN